MMSEFTTVMTESTRTHFDNDAGIDYNNSDVETDHDNVGINNYDVCWNQLRYWNQKH